VKKHRRADEDLLVSLVSDDNQDAQFQFSWSASHLPCNFLCYLPSHLIEFESSTSWKLEGAGKRADDETLLSGLMASLLNPIRIGLRMCGIGTQRDPRPAASRQRDITDLDAANIHQGLFRCPTSPS
jgi:hypothetical protein